MAEVTIKLDSPIITTDKSISEITTDGLANTGEIALATDGIVGNVNGALRKYPNPIKTFYVEKFVAMVCQNGDLNRKMLKLMML